MLFDVFERQLERTQPQFSSFFTNHVASAMHRYWAAHRPEDYEGLGLGEDWVEMFRDEVIWATGQASAMIGRLSGFVEANPGFELWIASSMGQRATLADCLETQLYLTTPARFMTAMGLPSGNGWQRRPAMLPQFNLVVEPEYVETFREAIKTVRIRARPLHFKRSGRGFFSLDFGQPNLHDSPDAVTVAGNVRSPESLGLEAVEITDRSGTTAYHVPEGILAIYDGSAPDPADGRPEVSVLEVAPTLLSRFEIAPRDYMVQPAVLN